VGDRDFTPVRCGQLRFGVQMCSEMMFPEHSRALGLAGAHLVMQLRATGPGKKWNVASEMAAVSSGSYVISANRRSYARDWFCGNSWLLSPEAEILADDAKPVLTARAPRTKAARLFKRQPVHRLRHRLVAVLALGALRREDDRVIGRLWHTGEARRHLTFSFHWLVNVGARFSTNAAIPSRRSFNEKHACTIRRSNLRPPVSGES
jgi:hypothetical protein